MAFFKQLFSNKLDFDLAKFEKARDQIPNDVWVYIFHLLSLRDLYSAAKVSKRWHQLIMKPINKDPSVFEITDTLNARAYLDKITQNLTKAPPQYSNNKTLGYKNFYTTMEKKISQSPLGSITAFMDKVDPQSEKNFKIFTRDLEIYLKNGLDIPLQKFLEKDKNSLLLLLKYLNNPTNIDTLFNSSINCFKVILNFISQKRRDYARLPFGALNNSTLLHIATEKGLIEFVSVLLTFSFSLTMKNKNLSLTPLALAHQNGNTAILTLLCEKISFEDYKDLDKSRQDFREKFQHRFGIPYSVYLEMTAHLERPKDESSRLDYIIKELTKNPKLINLVYDIMQKKNPDLVIEKVNELLNPKMEDSGSFDFRRKSV